MSSPEPRRRMTSTDVARAAGVSRATVGFVLNDTPGQAISAETRRRVLEAARRLGYRPNRAARALARGRSDIVLVVVPDWPMNDVLATFLDKVSEILDKAGYSLMTWTQRADRTTRPLAESLDADLVMGLAGFDDEDMAALRASGVTKIVPRPTDEWDISGFTIGSCLQVDHLYNLGHRRLAFARPADRRFGFLEQFRLDMAHAQADLRGAVIADACVVDDEDGSADIAVRTWKEMGCTGVVAYNDEVAAVVVGAALRAGIGVPDGLSVIGHDDSRLAALFVPGITSARPGLEALARGVAGEALRELGAPMPPAGPLPPAVVRVRASTGPPHR